MDFIRNQRDAEIAAGRFSELFGPDLLPGMYSTPIHAVPKGESDDSSWWCVDMEYDQ